MSNSMEIAVTSIGTSSGFPRGVRLLVLLVALGTSSMGTLAQSSQDAAGAAADAAKNLADAMANTLRNDGLREAAERQAKDPTWKSRLALARQVSENKKVHERYVRHIGGEITKCFKEITPAADIGTEKYDAMVQRLSSQIGGAPPLGILLMPGAKAFQASILQRSERLADSYSKESLELAVQMLETPSGTPIIIKWAASEFNIYMSCYARPNDTVTTAEDGVYVEVRRQLNF